MLFYICATIFVSVATFIFIYIKWIDTYWERRGVFTYRPKSKDENVVLETYKYLKTNGIRFGSYVRMYRPCLVTTDLDIIKQIMIKESEHFINRGMYSNRKHDTNSGSLPRLENAEWKSVRSVLSPIFSSGKLKMIFPDISAHAKIMEEVLESHAVEPFEAREMARRFAMDSMGSCTFGFEINTLKGQNKEFHDLVSDLLKVTWKNIAENLLNKHVLDLIRLKTSDPKVDEYVRQMVEDTAAYREKNNIKRNDIFQYIQQITDKSLGTDELVKDKKISNTQMFLAIQTFFLGGFETASTLTSFALLELALNRDKQDKLRENIQENMEKHGEFTYEAVMEMEYLDWVINESLRKYPPAQHVSRICNKTYQIPNSDIVVYPGEFLSVPIMGIHHDPVYYPEPEKFIPERFSQENKAKRHPMTFLPFGDGPRICIGARLGQLIAKAAVAAAVRKYNLTLNKKTSTPIRYNKKTILLNVEGGVWLNASKL